MSLLDDNIISDPNSGLKITGEMKRSWMTSSKWALFLAILGFIYIGLMLLMIGSFGTIMQMVQMMSGNNPFLSVFGSLMSYMTGIMVVMLAVMFFIHFYHLRFATQIQRAVNFSDQSSFEKAWMNLRNHFRLFGIVLCVTIGFYIIMFAFFGTALLTGMEPQ